MKRQVQITVDDADPPEQVSVFPFRFHCDACGMDAGRADKPYESCPLCCAVAPDEPLTVEPHGR